MDGPPIADSPLAYANPLLERFSADFFSGLPEDPGVYFFLDQDCLPLYIGKADVLRKRLMSYRRAHPGNVPEHTLEMLDQVAEIRWEIHPSGAEALRRESELLRAIRPPFNIAGTDPLQYLYIGLRFPGTGTARRTEELRPVEFRLTSLRVTEGFRLHGCYRPRRLTKSAYSALLRLFFAATTSRDRFYFPAKLCGAYPPYSYAGDLPCGWEEPLSRFLDGESQELLPLITFRLLERTNIPRFMYAPLQDDLDLLAEFYERGPLATRAVARTLGLKTAVSQSGMNRFATRSLSSGILRRASLAHGTRRTRLPFPE